MKAEIAFYSLKEDKDPYHLSRVSFKMLYEGTAGISPSNLTGFDSFALYIKELSIKMQVLLQ